MIIKTVIKQKLYQFGGGFDMSVCTFIAANCPMDEVRPSKKYPL
jgi:hypothetical protein